MHTQKIAALTLAAAAASAAPGRLHAATPQCGTPDQAGSRACFIDPTIDPAALCNDGTTPAFWVRPGSGSGAARWVIWLEGGGECADQTQCAMRAQSSPDLLTSNGFKAGDGVGVLSPNATTNPLLYNANTVLVHYCSSDDWSGNYTTTHTFSPSDPTTWNFQGRRIALAAVRSLNELGLGFAAAQQILLGGTSAGGEGITVTANDILPVLPAAAKDVRFVNDAGFALNIGQYDSTAPSPFIYQGKPDAFTSHFEAALSLWQGRGDAKCDATAHTTLQHVNCYNSSLVLQHGYIALPSFVAESQIDTAQLTDQLCPLLYGNCNVPHDPNSMQGIYATAFGMHMAAQLKGAGTPAAYSVFSPDAYMHVILSNSAVYTTPYAFPGGPLLARDVFDDWLAHPTGPRIVDLGSGPGVAARVPGTAR